MNSTMGRYGRRLGALLILGLAACGGSGPSEPADETPVITVTGVTDGASYAAAVTITIAVDVGSYTARLDGASFTSGGTVSLPGAHTLVVDARNGTATSRTEIDFTIGTTFGGAVIVRMFDLGPNDSGGGGDAILITDSTAGRQIHALIDAGPAGANASDPGFVARRLLQLGVDSLAMLLLTHAHADHFWGMDTILARLEVARFVYNGQLRDLIFYENLVTRAQNTADSVIEPTALYALRLGNEDDAATFTVVPPLPTYLLNPNAQNDEINEGSLGGELKVGGFRMFFTGDGEYEANERWRTQFATLTQGVDVLKVGHHGANNAVFDPGFGNTSSWLTHTAPEVSIISANGTTHPRVNALSQIITRTTDRTYCTNIHGDITLRITRTGTYTVSVEKNGSLDCVPGEQADS